MIEHLGRGAAYVVLCWWDRENELPIRVLFSDPTSSWRPAQNGESICVWDLQIINFERDAYVATVLGGVALHVAVEQYLDRHYVSPVLTS